MEAFKMYNFFLQVAFFIAACFSIAAASLSVMMMEYYGAAFGIFSFISCAFALKALSKLT